MTKWRANGGENHGFERGEGRGDGNGDEPSKVRRNYEEITGGKMAMAIEEEQGSQPSQGDPADKKAMVWMNVTLRNSGIMDE